MKTLRIWPCLLLWHVCCLAAADPLADQFQDFLKDILGKINDAGGLSLSCNLTDYKANIINGSDGWLSLREGHLYDLSSWHRSQDATITCLTKYYSVVSANITFDPLMFSYNYYIDNGSSLSTSRDLKGNITGLSATLDVTMDMKNTSYVKATFRLLPTGNVTSVLPPEDSQIQEDVITALGRVVNDEVLHYLQSRILNVIESTLSKVSLGTTSVSCTEATGVANKIIDSTPEITALCNHSADTKSNWEKHKIKKVSFVVQDENRNIRRDDSATSQIKQLNKFIDNLLKSVGDSFSSENLESFRIPDSDEELYQESDGLITLDGNLLSTSSVSLSLSTADPEVLRGNNFISVTAETILDDISYDFNYDIISNSTGNIHGKITGLTAKVTVVANVTDPSEALTTLDGFEMLSLVTFVRTGVSSDNGLTVDQQLAVYDAVRGAFKTKIIPFISSVATPILREAVEGNKMNVSEALAATTPAPTTTTAPVTTTLASTISAEHPPNTVSTSTVSSFNTASLITTSSHEPSTTDKVVNLTASAPVQSSSSSTSVSATTVTMTDSTTQPGSSSTLNLHKTLIAIMAARTILLLVI